MKFVIFCSDSGTDPQEGEWSVGCYLLNFNSQVEGWCLTRILTVNRAQTYLTYDMQSMINFLILHMIVTGDCLPNIDTS